MRGNCSVPPPRNSPLLSQLDGGGGREAQGEIRRKSGGGEERRFEKGGEENVSRIEGTELRFLGLSVLFLHSSFATYVDSPRRSLRDLSHLLFPKVKLRREHGLQWKVNQFCSATSQTNLSHPIPGRKHKAPLLRKKQTQAKQPFRAGRKQRKAKTFRIPLPPPAAKGRREGGKQGRHKVSISPRLLLAKAAAAAAAAASFGNRRRRLLPNSQGGRKKELLLLLDDTVQTCVLQVESPPTSPGRAPFVLGGGRPPPLFPRRHA